jgi:hypothetical protein
VTAFFIFGGGDNTGQGLAITTASVMASDVIESVSIVITGGETTRAFFSFFRRSNLRGQTLLLELGRPLFNFSSALPLKSQADRLWWIHTYNNNQGDENKV